MTGGRGYVPRSGGLFGDTPPEHKPSSATYQANIDGGSRGNPGPAAYGVVIRDGKGEVIALGTSLWWNWIASDVERGADNALLLQNLLMKPGGGS